jgi:hypothetical protein
VRGILPAHALPLRHARRSRTADMRHWSLALAFILGFALIAAVVFGVL